MKFWDFLKDKFIFLGTQVLLVVFLAMIMNLLKAGTAASLMICLLALLGSCLSLAYEYIKRKRYYQRLYNTLTAMDKKQYIASLLEEPDFADAKILTDIIKTVTKAMNDEIASHQIAEEEYREYIETWIHEVKIPISCIDLICKNNKSETTDKISDEVMRIDNYIEQALFYARSTNVEKDYAIQDIELETFVRKVVKKHSKQLIACKTQLTLTDLKYTVYSDTKWLDFIIGQLISNSIKYRREPFRLSFSAQNNVNQVILSITDNGIGIPEADLTRVLEKGFTGQNGRRFAKSTGIGLFLCNRLCQKMHLKLELKSKVDSGTTVKLIFPKDKTVIWEQ